MVTENMLVLAIDTSTLIATTGWFCTEDEAADGATGDFAELIAPAHPGHAETLLARIQAVLAAGGFALKDIDLLSYSRGPGTFTGLRIGLATVKGIALAFRAPIIGVSSLEALAFSAGQEGLVATLIDAKRKELFSALWRAEIRGDWPRVEPIVRERVGPFGEVISQIARETGSREFTVVGNGVKQYRAAIAEQAQCRAIFISEKNSAPSAYWIARIGLRRFLERGPDDTDSATPCYLREPDVRRV